MNGLIIVIVIILMAILLIIFNRCDNKEHFWFIPQNFSNSLCDVNKLSNLDRHQCKRCANAGYCTFPTGESECVNGDWKGSTSDLNCASYEYGNSYTNLSLVDAHQPYFLDTHKSWNWDRHQPHTSINDDSQFFYHQKLWKRDPIND
jgi:hypothetical protein